jgi:APA family basic amino acid/polyamine antiporter
VTPIIGIAGSAYILINTMVTDPMRSLIGMAVTLLGLPVYMLVKKRR